MVVLIIIATFNVQNFSLVTLADDTVQLTCSFAINSSADGCNVAYKSTHSQTVTVFIPKNEHDAKATTNYTGIPEGLHTFSVYDVIDGVSNVSLAALNGLEYNIVYSRSSTVATGKISAITVMHYLMPIIIFNFIGTNVTSLHAPSDSIPLLVPSATASLSSPSSVAYTDNSSSDGVYHG